MIRRRMLKGLCVACAMFAAVCVLMAVVHTQGPGNGQGLQLGLYKGRQVVAGEVLVKLRDDARLAPMPQDLEVDQDEQVGDGSIRRIHSRSHNIDTLLAKLADFDEVEYAEPNYVLYALETVPNEPYFPTYLWGFRNTGQTIQGVSGTPGADIKATQAWDLTRGSAANAVGVVDTGIDYAHPDLSANVWSALQAFTVVIGGQTITCAAGTHGFNAIAKTCDPMDDNGHGTHVSGTIGALGNNGAGVVGVNWTAGIMGLKFLDRNGSGSTANAINAIEFAIQAKAKAAANVRVLSNSWGGGGFSQSLLDEINKADTNAMLFPVAAGNNGSNNDSTAYYPANYGAPNVIAVAATDNRDALASFSNYGATMVDLGAPGVNILSTYPANRYAWMSGTSMATPHVAGAAALVLSVCGSLDTAGLKSVLLNTVDRIASLAGKTVTGGRLNVFAAVSGCETVPPPQADFSISASPGSRTVKRGQTTTYAITISPLNGFAGTVGLSVSAPSSVTASISPEQVLGGSGTSTVTATPASRGTFTLIVTGTSGSLTHSASVTVKAR